MHSVSLIVGNGFDLNLGLQTSYANFLQSTFFPRDDDPSSLATHLRTRHEIDGWVDVEVELARFSANQPARTTLKSEFRALRESLSNYIQAIDAEAILTTSKAFEIFGGLAASNQLNIISFNYTKTIEILIERLRSQGVNVVADVHNLHGTADSRDIIFGVDDQADVPNRHSFLYKTTASNFAGRGISQMLLQSNETHWFGHSLGSPDHMYFKEFFSVVIDQQTDKKFTFYHYGEDGNDALHAQLQVLTHRRVAKFKSNHLVKLVDVS
jgi:hypothetical protein